jgi:hypothetical protein
MVISAFGSEHRVRYPGSSELLCRRLCCRLVECSRPKARRRWRHNTKGFFSRAGPARSSSARSTLPHSAGTMNSNNCLDTSNAGNHQTDWRLPNIRELLSLLDFVTSALYQLVIPSSISRRTATGRPSHRHCGRRVCPINFALRALLHAVVRPERLAEN